MLVKGKNEFNLRSSNNRCCNSSRNNVPKLIFLRKILSLNISFGVKWFLLNESNIHGTVKTSCNRRITLIPLFIGGISYEYAFDDLGIKFTPIKRDIGKTPKHFHRNIKIILVFR